MPAVALPSDCAGEKRGFLGPAVRLFLQRKDDVPVHANGRSVLFRLPFDQWSRFAVQGSAWNTQSWAVGQADSWGGEDSIGGMGDICLKVSAASTSKLSDGRAACFELLLESLGERLACHAGSRACGLVPLWDWGQLDSRMDLPVLTYEIRPWVYGNSMFDLMYRGNRGAVKVNRFDSLRAVSCALAAFHAVANNGMMFVHGDVKPSNVIITPGKRSSACFVDFDTIVAVQRGREASCHEIGSFEYAAPELLLRNTCSQKSDVYSFGVLAHELLTGVLPYRFIRSRKRGLSFWRGVHVSGREVALRPGLPSELRELIGACLSPSPQNRPCAYELMRAIGEFEHGEGRSCA